MMSSNLPMVLTLSLLTLMAGAAIGSGIFGYALRRDGLKGITQPDTPSTTKFIQRIAKDHLNRREPVFLKEADILSSVISKTEKVFQTPSPKISPIPSPGVPSPNTESSTIQFPLTSQVSGVVMIVHSLRQDNNLIILNVSLQNNSVQSVRFLYSFLTVVDDRGRVISATANNLPGEMPPKSIEFSGTVTIPAIALDGAISLSLSLPDYPDQLIRLQVSGIPIHGDTLR